MMGRLSDIDLRLLRVFAAVVEAGGFSLATAKLNVAESTISQQMTDLEKRIGVRLCERGRAGFKLTRNGQRIYKLTIDLLTEVERFRDQVAAVHSELSGTLRLGLPDGFITDRQANMERMLSEFLRRYPDVSLEVDMKTPRELERAVIEGRLHVAIAPEHRRVAGLKFTTLYAERNALFCGSDHPLFGAADRELKDEIIAGCERIARGYLDRFDEQFFSQSNYRATVHQIEAAALLILTGQCIGFLPMHYAQQWVAEGRMRALRPDHYSFNSSFGVILRPDMQTDPRVANLMKVLKKHFANGR